MIYNKKNNSLYIFVSENTIGMVDYLILLKKKKEIMNKFINSIIILIENYDY